MINWKQMIEANEIFLEDDVRLALWCEQAADTNGLAMMANKIAESKVRLISVPPEIVSYVWTCLEKIKVCIFTRYSFAPLQKNIDKDIDDLSKNIAQIFKQGASGVQIFIKMQHLEHFVDVFASVRDDLFFNRKLSVCMDIEDLDINNLGMIFQKLKDIKADSFGLTFTEDMGNRSDFIGRVYALLEQWDFDGELHFILLNNMDRVDQVVRLTEILKPDLINKTKFFF